jgi:molybdopterin-containing oxidoreductase family membrane subunit
MSDVSAERILAPLENTTWRFGVLVASLSIMVLVFLYGWFLQLRHGLIVTGLGDWGTGGGAPWGLYIGTFVWWVGIAHGGIAISAAVKVFDVERFEPIARIAEVLTIIALMMSAFNIVVDLGHPERVFNTIVMLPSTIFHSPLAWDVTVVTLYLVLSATYLILSMRQELAEYRDRLPGVLQPFYGLFLLGYRSEEDAKIDRMTWWLALTILALVPLLSGGVVPWLFALVSAQPGWYSASTGPLMLAESLTSAIAVVIIVAAGYRYAFDWDFIERAVFRGLTVVLGFLTLVVTWLMLHKYLVGSYAPMLGQASLIDAMFGSPVFMVVAGLLVAALLYIGLTVLARPGLFSIAGSVVASLFVTSAIWIEKVLFVVDGLLHPTSPPLANLYPSGIYVPTLTELVITFGSVVTAALLFAIATKLIPMVELPTSEVEE